MIGDDRAGDTGIATPAGDPWRAPGAPNDDAGEELDRERRQARRASLDACRAEREVLDLRIRLSQLTDDLKAERRRYRAFRQRRSIRLAVALADRLRALARFTRRRQRAGIGRSGDADDASRARPGSTPARSEEPLLHAETDPRSVAEAYRTALLAALFDPRARGHALRVTLVQPRVTAAGVAAGDPMAGLGAALTARGYEVTVANAGAPAQAWPGGTDVAIVVDPAVDAIALPTGVVRVAWTTDGAAAWPAQVVAEYDVVVSAPGDPGQSFVDAVERWLRATRVAIRVPSGSARTAPGWGDTYLARDLRAALRTAGWPTRMHFRDRWDDPGVGHDDVVIDLLGRYVAETRPGSVRVLWQISHPELGSAELYGSYDLVFVASDRFANVIAEEVPGLPVRPLHQATDPARFCPTPKGPAHELLYVANWRERRPIVEDLLPTTRRLAVFGRGWTPERVDPAHYGGESIPNDQLSPYYAAASIVLNDHAAGMRREGFLSNRLYDAAAAGALVITDEVDGVDDEFDGGVVAYRDRRHLHDLIDRFLANPDEARALGERARRAVLARHTFAHRAQSLIAAIEPLLARSGTSNRR